MMFARQVGFRYDCDATAQVWSNCADITIE
jgi:hypothetical protein